MNHVCVVQGPRTLAVFDALWKAKESLGLTYAKVGKITFENMSGNVIRATIANSEDVFILTLLNIWTEVDHL